MAADDAVVFLRPDGLTDAEWTTLSADIEAYADLRWTQIVDARTFAPHVVKHNVKTDADGTKRDTVSDCPDCQKGLVSKRVGSQEALVCYDVVRADIDVSALKLTHHDVIACGRHGGQ